MPPTLLSTNWLQPVLHLVRASNIALRTFLHNSADHRHLWPSSSSACSAARLFTLGSVELAILDNKSFCHHAHHMLPLMLCVRVPIPTPLTCGAHVKDSNHSIRVFQCRKAKSETLLCLVR
ncbi:hypothetical protein BDP27DRAFT_313749 [Rhodocollybia butyracea]|uniref:Uncharacterized protein n=1 Tax=Rhodocollybia butyracea TaxID=206335 RepID=A0A9P5UBJ3_9AGAR|nr:hypothetical protein BDP27DRAFT_313749 [Rhodocollybia butyracea]